MKYKRILYGDDKEQNRSALARALRLRNFEVDLAETPQEFLSKARARNYHALITDLEYTENGREGYEVLQGVRNLPALKVLFSGIAGFEYEAEAYEKGADYAVMRKDSSALLKLLDEKLNAGGENGR
jgi:DNA-binding NtrC family response regulator